MLGKHNILELLSKRGNGYNNQEKHCKLYIRAYVQTNNANGGLTLS